MLSIIPGSEVFHPHSETKQVKKPKYLVKKLTFNSKFMFSDFTFCPNICSDDNILQCKDVPVKGKSLEECKTVTLDSRHWQALFHVDFPLTEIMAIVNWTYDNEKFHFILWKQYITTKGVSFNFVVHFIRKFLSRQLTKQEVRRYNRWCERVRKTRTRKLANKIQISEPKKLFPIRMSEYWNLQDIDAYKHIRLRAHFSVQILEVIFDMNREIKDLSKDLSKETI
jgi:hypothetical protein